jgi:disulfide bond formation protein DsbB
MLETVRRRPELLLALALAISVFAIAGSLYFQFVDGYLPCDLCWYQRICMYPLVAIFAIGLIRKDKGAHLYALPLALIGFFISVYHNIIYYIANYTTHSISTPCSASGISCTAKYVQLFGFLSIPMMALLGFIAVLVLIGTYHALSTKK